MNDVVIIKDTSPADIIQVVTEGPQGVQGPRGDAGDVTPELQALADSAVTSATAANTSAATATTAATSATASATTATNAATAANTSATAATTAATSATASATTATNAATAANTSATTATDSASAAAASAVQAAELVAQYQGALPTDPALDKGGNPLTEGDWYVNSTTGFVRVYTGTIWVQGPSGIAGVSSINDQVGALKVKTVNSVPMLGEGNIDASPNIIRIARTGDTTLSAANKGSLIDITNGTFAQTFATCASLGSGWFAYLQNSGDGDITLTPSASETIDGLMSYVMYPKEVRLVQCDGLALRTIVIKSFYKTYSSSGTFIRPPGYAEFDGLLWGSGGNGTSSIGGGGGACVPLAGLILSIGVPTIVVIGSAGGGSVIGTLLAWGGGSSTTGNWAGGGGWYSAGSSELGGAPNPVAGHNDFGGGNAAGALGTSIWGGGAGGGVGSFGAKNGGKSFYGGGGGAGPSGSYGLSVFGGNGGSIGGNGSAPGGGGGIGTTIGGSGELRIWGII